MYSSDGKLWRGSAVIVTNRILPHNQVRLRISPDVAEPFSLIPLLLRAYSGKENIVPDRTDERRRRPPLNRRSGRPYALTSCSQVANPFTLRTLGIILVGLNASFLLLLGPRRTRR